MVPGEGLEPTRIAPEDFKSSASASSATPAQLKIIAVSVVIVNLQAVCHSVLDTESRNPG